MESLSEMEAPVRVLLYIIDALWDIKNVIVTTQQNILEPFFQYFDGQEELCSTAERQCGWYIDDVGLC